MTPEEHIKHLESVNHDLIKTIEMLKEENKRLWASMGYTQTRGWEQSYYYRDDSGLERQW